MDEALKLDICSECKSASKSAIHAAKRGHTRCLIMAYNQLGGSNQKDEYGASPIHFAARFGKLECLKWLVKNSKVTPNAKSMNGDTAAHDAAAMGNLDCLEYLLKNTKCSVDDTTVDGATVLHFACTFGRLGVVKWLMTHAGSTPSDKGSGDITPVHLCAAKSKFCGYSCQSCLLECNVVLIHNFLDSSLVGVLLFMYRSPCLSAMADAAFEIHTQ